MVEPWAPEAFEARYQADVDPWDFRTSTYERHRYDRTIAALRPGGYDAAYEPGCSVGELTALLAEHCHRVRAVDVAPTAVEAARARCADLLGVTVAVGGLLGGHRPDPDGPAPTYDLVVLSEVGYYVDVEHLDRAVDELVAALAPGGDLVGCHWLGHSDDHVLHGSVVHERIAAHPSLTNDHHEDHPGFVLDRWSRT